MINNYILPEKWFCKKLGDIAEITSSKRVFESEWKIDGVPFYRAREIVKLAKQGFIDNGIYISEQMFEEYSQKYGKPQENDIMITGVGTLGVCYLVKKNDRFYFKDGNIIWIKNISDFILPMFLLHMLNSEYIQKQIKSFSSGNTVGTYTIENAKKTIIPFPSIEKQKRIVKTIEAKLSAVEKAKKASDEQIFILNKLFDTYLKKMFNLHGQTELVKLEEICQIIAGQSPKSDTYSFERNGLPFYQGKADFGLVSPTPKVWCSEPLKIAEKDDILLSVRAPVGPTNIANEKCCIGRGLCAIRAKENVSIQFLLFFFKLFEKEISKMGSGSTFSAITIEDVKKFKVPHPPLNEQKRFANIIEEKLAAVEKAKKLTDEQSIYINALSQSILRKAFNGGY
jgi:type I restriction enzyme S subunit